MRALWSAARLGAQHRFAYRLEVLVAAASAVIVVALNASVWRSVGEGRPTVAGMDQTELTTYVVVAWLVAIAAGTQLDGILAHRFRSGEIAADLLRPLDLQAFLTARSLGRSAASLTITAIPVLLLSSLAFPIRWPDHAWAWPAAGVSALLGALIGAELAFLVGITVLRLRHIEGLTRIKAIVVAVLSGAVIPLDAMPAALLPLVDLLPFRAIAHLPTCLFLERYPLADIWWPFSQQLVWCLGLLLLCRSAWHWALQDLTVQGG